MAGIDGNKVGGAILVSAASPRSPSFNGEIGKEDESILSLDTRSKSVFSIVPSKTMLLTSTLTPLLKTQNN